MGSATFIDEPFYNSHLCQSALDSVFQVSLIINYFLPILLSNQHIYFHPQLNQFPSFLILSSSSRTVYTCALNDAGGVEADVTISRLATGSGQVYDPKFEGQGYYIVAGGASAYYTYSTLQGELRRKGFNAQLTDVTADLGVISIQGPSSRRILQPLLDCDLSDEHVPPNGTRLASLQGIGLRLLRVSFVGELGYELHVPKADCVAVYKALMQAGAGAELRNAGYRALYSLSSEKGYHLWSFDLRADDTPLEAGLGFTCRKTGDYRGRAAVDRQRSEGLKKRLVYLTLRDQLPIWGLEGVYRNGEPVGVLRRAEYAYTLGKSLGQVYISRRDNQLVDVDYIKSGDYEVDILGKRYKADCHLRSPFDPTGQRVLGNYEGK